MTRLSRHPVGACAVLVVALAACGCARGEGGSEASRRARLETIGVAQGLLHEADVLEGLGDRATAVARARAVLELPLAPDDPLREPLRLDAWGRVAELAIADGSLDEAERAVQSGLDEVSRPSYFEARLHLVRGRVLEARAARARDEGRDEDERTLLREALEAHERSIAINRALLAEDGDRSR